MPSACDPRQVVALLMYDLCVSGGVIPNVENNVRSLLRLTWGFVLVTTVNIGRASAQTPDLGTVTEVQYEAGGIKTQYLPYGRRWAITGSPTTGRGVADVVIGRFRTHSPAKFNPLEESPCWVRPLTSTGAPDKAIGAFRINFDRESHRLVLGESYDVRLEFYSEGAGSGLLAPVIGFAYQAGVALAERNQSIALDELMSAINGEVVKALEPLMSGDNPSLVHLSNETLEGRCKLLTTIPKAVLSDADARQLQRALIDQVRLTRANQKLDVIESQITDSIEALNAIRAALLSAVNRANSGVTTDDVQALVIAVENGRMPTAATAQRLFVASRSTTCAERLGLSTVECVRFRSLATLLVSHAGELSNRPDEAEVRKTKEQVQLVLRGAYRVVSRTEITAYAYDNIQATSDKLRLGTLYVFGAAFLNIFGGSKTDGFALTALKLYRHPVDKSLPDPYFGRSSSRNSLVIGIVSNSTLRYRGQPQEKLVGDLNPLLGIARDLTRDLTLQVGLVGFRQPSTNPAATATSPSPQAKIAPYVSVGFDFDAANRLKALLTK